MAYIIEHEKGWHSGEDRMHQLLHVPPHENPTTPYLSAWAASLMLRSPLLALGAVDQEGLPWATVWGGDAGFMRPIEESTLGIRTVVDRCYDPVVQSLTARLDGNQGSLSTGLEELQVAGLAIDLQTRRRVKFNGIKLRSSLAENNLDDDDATAPRYAEIQMAILVEGSMGNCPKYLNSKKILPAAPRPLLRSETLPLPQEALDLISKADLFFISSSHHEEEVGINHRGGPPGFVRIVSNDRPNGTVLVYPEYSGNRLYQSLGNIIETPRVGIVFPDFDTGDVLYLSGTASISIGADAAKVLEHSNLAVSITITHTRFVKEALPFRGKQLSYSPYNPRVRYLPDEKLAGGSELSGQSVHALLINKEILTSEITKFRFKLENTGKDFLWKAGQYVTLNFENELSAGYSHMRDEDPQSLNDDYLRTFTISSSPHQNEFEITVRNVGKVTGFLRRQNPRNGLEVPLMGFGGEFFIRQQRMEEVTFVAGGVGITPLLPQIQELELERFKLFWGVAEADVGLVIDVLKSYPDLQRHTSMFITRTTGENTDKLDWIAQNCYQLEKRRLVRSDLEGAGIQKPHKWYLCANPSLKASALEWLAKEEVIIEDFNY